MGEDLGRELVKAGLLEEAQRREAEKYRSEMEDQTRRGLARILVKLRFVKEADLLEHVAKREGLEIVRLDDEGALRGPAASSGQRRGPDDRAGKKEDAGPLTLDEEFLKRLPDDLVQRHALVPVGHDRTYLRLALPDPSDLMAIEDVRFRAGLEVQVMLISESDALKVLSRYYNKDLKPVAVASKPHSRTEARRIVRQVGQLVAASEAARTVGSLEASPAKLIRALTTLLVDKGVVTAEELKERLQVME